MSEVDLAEAGRRLGELIEEAARGESVYITRNGEQEARISAVERRRKAIQVSELRRLTSRMPLQAEAAATVLRRMRDAERYW